MHKYDWLKAGEQNAQAEKVAIDAAKSKDKAFWEHLSKEAYPVTHGSMRIPISIEPFIIDKGEYDTIANDLGLFMSAAQKIANAYYTDAEIAKTLAIDERERDLIASARDKNCIGVVRLDLFYADKTEASSSENSGPKIVEINSDYPDGFFMHDVTAGAIRDLLPDANISSSDSGPKSHAGQSHAELFSDLLQSEGVSKDMHVFIGFDKERTFIDEFYVTKNSLEKLGWTHVSVGHFEDLEFKGSETSGTAADAFYFEGKKVDALRRGSELSKIRKIPDFVPKLLAAEKNGLIIINNFKMRLLGYKSLLAALWDERFHKYLAADEIASIKKLLPLTLKLDDAKISKEILAKEKSLWVIKPIDLAEGADVFVGDSLSADEWSAALDRAYKNPSKWIAQHKVIIPRATFNLIETDATSTPAKSKISSYERKYDFNPHIILYKDKAELGTILVRFSESAVVNVAKGGGITYAFKKS